MAGKTKEQIRKESDEYMTKYGMVGAAEEPGLVEGDLILDYTPVGMGRGAVTKAGAQSYEAIKAARLARELDKRLKAGMSKADAKKEIEAIEAARKAPTTQNYGGLASDPTWSERVPTKWDNPLSTVLENIQNQSRKGK